MKSIILFSFLLTASFAACNGPQNTRNFIPGTYVNYAEGEFSVAYDTLIIQPLSGKKGTYRILRKSAYRRIEHNRLQPVVHKKEEWTGLYNDETKSMQETRHGRVITFYPEARRLMVEKREYEKID